MLGEESHASSGHEKDGRFGNLFTGYFFEGNIDERFEMIVTDGSHVLGEGRDAWVNFLALLELQLW